MDTLASRLLTARTKRGLSQAALAKLAGVSQSTIGNIEAGIRDGGTSLASIADALGVRYFWLRDGDGPMEAGKFSIDAQTLAEAFDALPTDTAAAIDRRAWLYDSLIGQIATQRAKPANAPAPAPDERPTATPRPRTKTRP